MSALSVQPAYPIFTEIDGAPLESGYIWIGSANLDPQNNPINVYWDAALTIQAVQPIRTLNGYPSNSGTPARLYVNSDYSIRVLNKKGGLVYSAPAATERYNETVVKGIDSENVVYNPPFTNSVQTNVEEKLKQTISVKDFGAVGNGIADDSTSIQAAITAATSLRKTVYFPSGVYLVSATINVPAGVRLLGESQGEAVNGTPLLGSQILYLGTGVAVSVNGALAGIEHIVVRGSPTAVGATGILINGDANLVESWFLNYVTIHNFVYGTGLSLKGINSGAVVYGTVESLRIRNAKIGINILDTGGGTGFTNTNQFYGGAINGGGFDYGIYIDGGNDNRFYGMSVEPTTSVYGHIYINKGNISFAGRIEANTITQAVPTVFVSANGSLFMDDTLYGGTLIQDNSTISNINVTSAKVAMTPTNKVNLLKNSGFTSVDTTALTIQDWALTYTGTAPTISTSAPEIVENSAVLRIDVPAGGTVLLGPAAANIGVNVTFGTYIKTASAGALVYIAFPGVASSSPHPADNLWHQIGMVRTSSGVSTSRIQLNNSTGVSTATYYITAPFLFGSFSSNAPEFNRNGGLLTGTIEGNSGIISLPATGDNTFYTASTAELTVPRWGNVIHITGTARTITRLNNVTANRFQQGTVIRLVFDIGGVSVTDGNPGFIDLTTSFTSATPATTAGRSWLLLEAQSGGVWAELDRRA